MCEASELGAKEGQRNGQAGQDLWGPAALSLGSAACSPSKRFFAPASDMSAVLSFHIEWRVSTRGPAGSLQLLLTLWLCTEGPVFPPQSA